MLQRDWQKITRYDIVILLHVCIFHTAPLYSCVHVLLALPSVLGAIIPAIYVIIYYFPLELQHRRVSGSTMQQVQRKPLIGQVTSLTDDDITIDWYVGTYSGLWKPWKGREGGETVTYTETIDIDVVIQTVTLTKSQRLTT